MKRLRVVGFVLAVAAGALALGCGGASLVGGSVGAAGAGGGVTSGVAGAGGGLAGADGGLASRTRSAGCGQSPDDALGRYVEHDITVPGVAAAYAATYTNRIYWVRLPKVYDINRAYTTVLLGPGCGTTGQSSIPIEEASKNDAIVIGMNGVDNCFNHDSVDTPDLPYFDAVLARVEADYCVDPSHVFVAGFSSGSWLTNYLGCARADVIRGQGSSAGGLPPIPACKGPIPAMLAADTLDPSSPPDTVALARDRVIAVNGCSAETEPYDIGVPSPCVQYKGCKPGYPVVWCVTTGQGHVDQAASMISTVGFWHFWTSLPDR